MDPIGYSGVLKDNMDYSTGSADAEGKFVALLHLQRLRALAARAVGIPPDVAHQVLIPVSRVSASFTRTRIGRKG
jgi:hypothetical protein